MTKICKRIGFGSCYVIYQRNKDFQCYINDLSIRLGAFGVLIMWNVTDKYRSHTNTKYLSFKFYCNYKTLFMFHV